MSKPNGPRGSIQTSIYPADTDKLVPREKLPADLQKLVDNDDSLFDQLYDGTANPTTDSNLRYAAYATRLRTILLSAHRYVAYTSDVGESFRPVAHPWVIRGAYGVSWAYLIGDVGHEGYKAYLQNQRTRHPGLYESTSLRAIDARDGDEKKPRLGYVPAIEDYRSVILQRAIFQSIASMGLPAFTIHSIVKYSGRALKDVKNTRIRTYGPIGLGLAAVPFLPFIFDKPVEQAVEWSFHKAFEAVGGPDAVKHSPENAIQKGLQRANKKPIKEKELGPNVSLSLIESTMLDGVIKAFIRGIEDREIQKEASRGLSAQDRSLRGIYTLADEARRTNLEVKKLVNEEAKTKELEYLRSLVLKTMSKAQLDAMLASGWEAKPPFPPPLYTPQPSYQNEGRAYQPPHRRSPPVLFDPEDNSRPESIEKLFTSLAGITNEALNRLQVFDPRRAQSLAIKYNEIAMKAEGVFGAPK